MEVIKTSNVALRFLLELGILAALGYWGFQAGMGLLTRIGLGIGLPVLAAALWVASVSVASVRSAARGTGAEVARRQVV